MSIQTHEAAASFIDYDVRATTLVWAAIETQSRPITDRPAAPRPGTPSRLTPSSLRARGG
jgi:hypothetical protein